MSCGNDFTIVFFLFYSSFIGETAKQVRVGVTCFFDNIALILQTIDFVGDPMSEAYSHY